MKIRDIIRKLRQDGWYEVAQKGSHRQYRHPTKRGRVTIAGHENDDLAPGTLNSVLKQAGIKENDCAMIKYLVIIEKASKNYSAYSPDLPGCIAAGKTRETAERNMKKAIEMHIRGLRLDNQPLPKPRSIAEYIQVG